MTEVGDRLLANGNVLEAAHTEEKTVFEPEIRVRIYARNGKFAGIYAYDGNRCCYKPVKMFLERE